jgi:hypothetical protein
VQKQHFGTQLTLITRSLFYSRAFFTSRSGFYGTNKFVQVLQKLCFFFIWEGDFETPNLVSGYGSRVNNYKCSIKH